MRLVKLAGGTFTMGSNSFSASRPLHDVTVSPFWIGQMEVTNSQFDLYRKLPRHPESLTNTQPAVRISYQDAESFCAWLSKKEKRKYRLPREAEWEFACRGGLHQQRYSWGNVFDKKQAVFSQITTNAVGSRPPNGYGLYDMLGNAREWVSDWHADDYYANSPKLDPRGPAKPKDGFNFRITRGGMYIHINSQCGQRYLFAESTQSAEGFRVVLEEK